MIRPTWEQCAVASLIVLGGSLAMVFGTVPAWSSQVRIASATRAASVVSTGVGITASTTQTQGQQPLTVTLNEVATVAFANDVVTAPAAEVGLEFHVINNGANTLQVFPASGDNLGGGVDTGVTLSSGSNITYRCYDATNCEAF